MKEIIARIAAGEKVTEEQLKGLTQTQQIVLQRLLQRLATLEKDIQNSFYAM